MPSRLLSAVLSLALVFPVFPIRYSDNLNNETLSPATPLTADPFFGQRQAIFSTMPMKADAARGTTDPNIFQGYDVRGIGFDEGKDKTNLRPEDAFLIAEAIAFTYRQRIKGKRSGTTYFDRETVLATMMNGAEVPVETPSIEKPRVLVTGDHRITSPALIAAAAAGAYYQGCDVAYDSGHVATGALNLIGLRDNYDIIIQITGSHNPAHHNGMKIAVRQDEKGFFDADGKLGALYGNRGFRLFELKSLEGVIKDQAAASRAARNEEGALQDIFVCPMDVRGSYLEKVPGRPRFGWIIGQYVEVLKKRFGKLKTPRRLVVDTGNGMGAAAIPVLENQGNTIERGLFIEVKGRPDHPADPSKDTAGTKPYNESGCRACIEAVRELNKDVSEEELPAIGVMTDGDGDRSGMVDEDGRVIRPSAIATLIYRRFILENKATLEELEQKLGLHVKLALDVRSSSVLENLTGVVNPQGKLLKQGKFAGVRGIYIPAGYPSHRDHVAKEIAKLRELQEKIRRGDFAEQLGKKTELAEKLEAVILSYVSAEASGHYFAATDETHPDVMIDDGIFFAARVLEILDTWNDFEGKEESIAVPRKEVYLLKDIFSQASIPTPPSPDEPRVNAPNSIDDRYAIIADLQKRIVAERQLPQGLLRGKIKDLVTMEQVTDGVRVMFEDGSALLMRTSNTGPNFTSMVEAESWSRVVEILEDAIRLLEPHKQRYPEVSTKDLEDKLFDARKKAVLETVAGALRLFMMESREPVSRETLVQRLRRDIEKMNEMEGLNVELSDAELAGWAEGALKPDIDQESIFRFVSRPDAKTEIVHYAPAPSFESLDHVGYASTISHVRATGKAVPIIYSPAVEISKRVIPLPNRISSELDFDALNGFSPSEAALPAYGTLRRKGEAYLQIVRQVLKDAALRAKMWMAWMKIHELPDVNVEEIKGVADRLNGFEDVVFIGIGGSDFGGQALHQLFNSSKYNQLPRAKRGGRPRVHFINTVDANDAKDLMEAVDPTNTAFVVISKSGGTEETKTAFEYFRKKVREGLADRYQMKDEMLLSAVDKRFVIITDLNMKGDKPASKLRQEFWRDSKLTALAELSVPDGVGGRFSVGSAVGLLPAAVVGIDIKQLMEGFKTGHDLSLSSAADIQNIAMRLALLQHLAYREGRKIQYFYPFGNRLNNLSKWYEQLVEESLGKTYPDGSAVDMVVKPTVGTRDNHSFVQNLLGGDPNSKFVIFLDTEKYGPDDDIAGDDGIHMDDKLAATLQGTRDAATQKGIPNVTIRIPNINPKDIGTLMYLLEASVHYWGEAFLELGGLTFLQDQVELYKIGTRKALEGMKPRRREPEKTDAVEQSI